MSFRRTRPKRFSLFFLGVDEFFSSFSFLNGSFEFTAICLNIFQKRHTQEREFCRIKKPRKGEKNKRHKKDAQKSLFSLSFLRSVEFTITRTRLLLIVIEEREYILQSI